MPNKTKNHNKTVVLARSKLNSIESKTSEALINNKIHHENLTTIVNEEKNYCELKESIRMMKAQEVILKKNYLFEEGKKIGIDELIKRSDFINNSLKSKI